MLIQKIQKTKKSVFLVNSFFEVLREIDLSTVEEEIWVSSPII